MIMFNKVKAYVKKHNMLSEGDIVVTGVSGGADSVCLLLVLSELKKEIPFRLLAVHVNHLIRKEAYKDEEFVRDLCNKLDVPFFLIKKDVEAIAKELKISTEEAGREVRYSAFEQIMQREGADLPAGGGRKIAVAHNLNDRAETMLFNLFRGSGLSGLSSIRPIRTSREGSTIIRPLLCVSREEIEAFLTDIPITWCIDSTNEEDTYTRNRIRHHILPFVEKEIAGGAVSNMGRAADILWETEDFIQKEAGTAYNNCAVQKYTEPAKKEALNIKQFLLFHPLIQKQIIINCIYNLTPAQKDITNTHIEDVLSLFMKKGNGEIHLPYHIIVRKEYDMVLFEKGNKEENSLIRDPVAVTLPVPGGPILRISLSDSKIMEFEVLSCENLVNIPENRYTKWFDYDKIKKSLTIRTRQPGDYLTFNAAYSKKLIQDYMVEEKIPSKKRDKIWLLAEDKHILWVTGHRISSYYKIDEKTKDILQVRLRGGKECVRACESTFDRERGRR